ncbi:hypothetical protein FVR03_24040 [Pontibacter qinzhouensis]|uniref:Uncharacterized protein n=1 Tax=Pontibacter qinzhouensis TaxID=2603253 RepID=A0A5C8IDW2_9BACT|nr:hypothetical protein [Pontibacter qinzhouensis]TXK18380.1 hypothetical protein FVR03_24040 [Pontibacter qinzhouensis]
MITLRNGQPMRFIVYKTHLPYIEADHKIILKNIISDQEKELTFQTGEFYNSFKIELDEIDLTAFAGQNTLFVQDTDGDIIYSEEVFVL